MGHLRSLRLEPHDPSAEPALARLDVDAALAGILDANAKLDRIVSEIATIRRILEDGDKRKRKVAEEELRRLLGEECFARHERTQPLLARAISPDLRPSDPQPAEAIERGPPTARLGPSGADPRRLRFGR